MTVFVVVSQHWDEATIEGVYDSLDSAKADNPPGRDCTWYDTDTGAFQTGLEYGWSVTAERFDVQTVRG